MKMEAVTGAILLVLVLWTSINFWRQRRSEREAEQLRRRIVAMEPVEE